MGMQLSGRRGGFWWNFFLWEKLLKIAVQYGWEPMGTDPPQWDEEETKENTETKWCGSYLSNDFQSVNDKDAENLAMALERSLPDMPDEDMMAPFSDTNGGLLINRIGPSMKDTDFFSGHESKEEVRKFILFCRTGGFSIE